jgi:tRNA/tmRNA/rRNA uracil-C5-methylase (TrmA/RlmC/RlmD family)
MLYGITIFHGNRIEIKLSRNFIRTNVSIAYAMVHYCLQHMFSQKFSMDNNSEKGSEKRTIQVLDSVCGVGTIPIVLVQVVNYLHYYDQLNITCKCQAGDLSEDGN